MSVAERETSGGGTCLRSGTGRVRRTEEDDPGLPSALLHQPVPDNQVGLTIHETITGNMWGGRPPQPPVSTPTSTGFAYTNPPTSPSGPLHRRLHDKSHALD